jgi:hypothetical protein
MVGEATMKRVRTAAIAVAVAGLGVLGSTLVAHAQSPYQLPPPTTTEPGVTTTPTTPTTPAEPQLLDPFPIVRIKGIATSRGARITSLRVRAPGGARIDSRCSGRGCPYRRAITQAQGSSNRLRSVRLRRFQRSFRAGVKLEIRVSAPNAFGKFTRFQIRAGKAPRRTDRCLSPTTSQPVDCPRRGS